MPAHRMPPSAGKGTSVEERDATANTYGTARSDDSLQPHNGGIVMSVTGLF